MSIKYLTGSMPHLGKVTPLISGSVYFNDFFDKLDDLKAGDKLFLLNWHIDFLFYRKENPGDNSLSGRPAEAYLLTKLQNKVIEGVDVRVLLWINTNFFEPVYPLLPDEKMRFIPGGDALAEWLQESGRMAVQGNPSLPFQDIMFKNLKTVYFWRNKKIESAKGEIWWNDPDNPFPQEDIDYFNVVASQSDLLQNRIIINTLDPMLGGCHSKFAIFLKKLDSDQYQGTGYTGGIDLAPFRYAGVWKNGEEPYTGFYQPFWTNKTIIGHNFWHDIMAKVEGTNAVAPLYWFYVTLWNENIRRRNQGFNPVIHTTIKGNLVQIPCIPDGATAVDETGELLFDLSNEMDDHLVQSVSTIPDIYPVTGEPEFSFAPEGSFELRDAIHHAFSCAETYIYVEDQSMESLELFKLLKEALVRSPGLRVILVTGGDPADPPSTIDRLLINHFFFSKMTPDQKERLHYYQANYTIHSKVYIVDDQLAIIGSGGFITRSMTEELEHAVAYIDNGGSSIQQFRQTLWSLHTRDDFTAYTTIEDALDVWGQDGFGNNDVTSNLMGIKRISLDDTGILPEISDFWQDIPSIFLQDIQIQSDQERKEFFEALPTEEREKYIAYLINKEATIYLLTHEVPFLSIFNPSQQPLATGFLLQGKKQVALNEIARIESTPSQISTINWDCPQLDGTPQTGTGLYFDIQFSAPGYKIVWATQISEEDDIEYEFPFELEVLENSGPHWVERFPTSKEIVDLSDEFRPKVQQFLQAITDAGLTYTIFATLRPSERAYLMANAWRISHGLDPTKVKKRMDNVNISWVHYNTNGDVDLAASRQAAENMVQAYNIGSTGAVYPSRHSYGEAIDVKIAIPHPVMVRNGKGEILPVSEQIHLNPIGLSYGLKRIGKSNHWSRLNHKFSIESND